MSLIGDGLELLGLLDKARNAELYKQLGDYIDKVRILQIENERLQTEQRELTEQLRFKGVLERINGHTFVQGEDEEICPRCATVDKRPIHIMHILNPKSGAARAACPQCRLEMLYHYPKTRAEALKKNLSPAIS